MKPVEYRKAACCSNCANYHPMSERCGKFGCKVDMEYTCDLFDLNMLQDFPDYSKESNS